MNTKQIPDHVEKQLAYLIDNEHEHPEYGKRIVEICDHWGI